MEYSHSVRDMWKAYLTSLGEDPATTRKTFTAWHFSDNRADAVNLAALVKAGTKSATSSPYGMYEHDQEPLPITGDHSVITDWDGEAQCIVRNTSVEIVPFNQVTAEFAQAEGEGDRSMAYWQRVHWAAFSRELHAIDRSPTEVMLVVCETFEVVHPIPGR